MSKPLSESSSLNISVPMLLQAIGFIAAMVWGYGQLDSRISFLEHQASMNEQAIAEMKSLQAQVEELKKEIALVREDAQIEMLRLEKRNSEHQKLNGELQVKLSKYEDKAAHYRRKAVL